MALRLNHVVLSGELDNTKFYRTRGELDFRGLDHPVTLNLTGNCGPSLAGCHIRFTARLDLQQKLLDSSDFSPIRDASDLDWLAHQQVGPTGTMILRDVKWFDCSPVEFYQRSRLGEPPPTVVKPALYLEWYSQNGRVVLELVDPEIEFLAKTKLVAPQPGAHLVTDPPRQDADAASEVKDSGDHGSVIDEVAEETQTGLGISIVRLDDEGRTTTENLFYPEAPEENPAGAETGDDESDFSSPTDELQRQLDAQAEEIEWAITYGDGGTNDSDDLRELKLMDDLIEGGTGTLLADLIHDPLQFPPPHDLAEPKVEGPLKSLLGQLAIFGIEIAPCEHFTPKEIYRWLMDEILPKEVGHVELQRTQWVVCFSTYESCPACEAESEREYEEYLRNPLPPRDDPPCSDDEIPF